MCMVVILARITYTCHGVWMISNSLSSIVSKCQSSWIPHETIVFRPWIAYVKYICNAEANHRPFIVFLVNLSRLAGYVDVVKVHFIWGQTKIDILFGKDTLHHNVSVVIQVESSCNILIWVGAGSSPGSHIYWYDCIDFISIKKDEPRRSVTTNTYALLPRKRIVLPWLLEATRCHFVEPYWSTFSSCMGAAIVFWSWSIWPMMSTNHE